MWLANRKTRAWRVQCWPNDVQEPYMLVRWGAKTPMFDQMFVNYGGDKIQFVNHLRSLGGAGLSP